MQQLQVPVIAPFEDRPARSGAADGDRVVLRDGREAEVRRVLLGGGSDGSGWVERLRQMALVRHPNLLPIAGGRAEDGVGSVYWEPAAGVTLAELLERHGPLSPAQGVAVGLAVLAGLEALQKAGFGHGRLTPYDVNIAPWGEVRLTGYGLAPVAEAHRDLAAAGRVICASLGIDSSRRFGSAQSQAERALPGLAATALTIARGGAGRSAATALMLLTDGAGRLAGRGRVYLSVAELGRLAAPTPALSGAVDSVMVPRRRPVALPELPRVALPKVPHISLPRVPRMALPALAIPVVALSELPRLRVPRPPRWIAPLAVTAGLLLVLLAVLPPIVQSRTAGRATAATPAAAPSSKPSSNPAPAAAAVAAPAAHDAVVGQFYQLVLQHRFDAAAALWSDRMKAAYPPSSNINDRFAETTVMTLNRASISRQDANTAVVAVDLTEVTSGFDHHWVGTWRLVRGPDGWLLDQPDFQGA